MLRCCLYPLFLLITLLSTGCYRMPTEDDCCLVPTTNNPDVYRDRNAGNNPMPGAGF